MATKTKYTAVDPDGGIHTRTSHRLYTHAVLVHRVHWQDDPAYLTESLARYEAYPDGPNRDAYIAECTALLAAATGEPTWALVGFCGRHDLAEKLAAQQRQRHDRVEIVDATT